jgi:hypothetical protein
MVQEAIGGRLLVVAEGEDARRRVCRSLTSLPATIKDAAADANEDRDAAVQVGTAHASANALPLADHRERWMSASVVAANRDHRQFRLRRSHPLRDRAVSSAVMRDLQHLHARYRLMLEPILKLVGPGVHQ